MTITVEIDERVKSRPEYSPVKLDLKQQQQVFISATGNNATLKRMFDDCVTQLGNQRVTWLVVHQDVKRVIAETAADFPLATAVYIAGTEAWMWDVRNALIAEDFAPEQIQMLAPESNARRLFCTHCYTVMEGVTHNPHSCSGCGELLLVRDHFSKLYGAYVGVSINAEDRSEIPATEALV